MHVDPASVNTERAQNSHGTSTSPTLRQTRHSQPDTVTLTHTATQLQNIERQIRALPMTDSRRIEQVRSALENGDYHPDPGHVAGKMLNLESVLNSSRT